MRNKVVYTNKKISEVKDTLENLDNIEELDIRVELSDDLKNYELTNPSLVVIENVPNLNDVLMTTKFKVPVLFVGDVITEVTVRALSHDYISKPFNKDLLVVRVQSLLKVKEFHDKIDQVSTTDELTGLHNRKYLQERLDAEISRARRYKTPLSCLLFDIDFFKVVNDMYGYEWGDVLLKNFADKLRGMIRKEDVLTRYGDEEFIVILPNTTEDNAFLFAERFRRNIEKMDFIPAGEEERHPITVSGGISTYPCLANVDEDANTIIRYAEHALYNAKKRGKNKIVQFSQINLEF